MMAFLRFIGNAAWHSLRHPLTTAVIDPGTGKVVPDLPDQPPHWLLRFDLIESARFDVEVDEGMSMGVLTLTGDFVSTCEAYLADPGSVELKFRLDRDEGEVLAKQISARLG